MARVVTPPAAVSATAATATAATAAPVQTPADAVRRRIASLVLHERETRTVGAFILRPAQCEAVRDITRAFIRYGGALLADPPGTGKTVIALAVAQREPDVLVAAPATLREQWRSAAERAAVAIRFVSLESLSHGADPPRASLLIVDEAHHARTPSTHRHARLARLAIGAHVLLLTATPVVNGRHDRDALLGLFLGTRARALDGADLARLVIRRAHAHVARPAVRNLPALQHAADIDGMADALRALPPPLPTADGSAATALLCISLAMTWSSSLAALDVALRRRVQRGAALADGLTEGRWPDHAALRRWVIGDDSTQLAMPLLVDDLGRAPPAGALEVLNTHLDAVRTLRAVVAPHVATDTAARVRSLRELCDAFPERRMVVFAQHAATVAALYRAMRSHAGVVGIVGDRVLATQGRWTRREVLRALGPGARPFNPRDPRGIRVLLATDLLAEGVELQGMGIVVHGDPAWTPTRLTQRVGRAVRFGGASEVCVTQFPVPHGAASILHLAPRLTRKATEGVEATHVARAEERLRHRLQRWGLCANPEAGPTTYSQRTSSVGVHVESPGHVASVAASCSGFIAVLRGTHGAMLVVGQRSVRSWRIGTGPQSILRSIARAGGADIPVAPAAVDAARRALTRWLRQQRAVAGAGLAPTIEPRLQRALHRRLSAAVGATPLATRERVARTASDAVAAVLLAPGSGVTRALEQLCRASVTPAEFVHKLCALAESTRRSGVGIARGTGLDLEQSASVPRLAALLILSEDPGARRRHARPAASPETAAPR